VRRLLLVPLLLLALALGACTPALPTEGDVRRVSVAQAADRVETVPDLVVLDVRTPEEFADGHLPGAVNIDFYDDDFDDRIAALDPDASYLVYCSQGGRSGSTGGTMRDLAFSDVTDMTDGFGAWRDAGLPVEG
jgi:rhodanese-related sulfurtransferase